MAKDIWFSRGRPFRAASAGIIEEPSIRSDSRIRREAVAFDSETYKGITGNVEVNDRGSLRRRPFPGCPPLLPPHPQRRAKQEPDDMWASTRPTNTAGNSRTGQVNYGGTIMATRDVFAPTSRRSVQPSQIAAVAVGAVFLLVGILGFLPGATSNLSRIDFIGHESEAELLGIFRVNVLHNIVHLLFGVVGLAAARTVTWSRNFLIYGGVIYVVLWIYGQVIDLGTAANFVSLNTADNWLHFSLGVAMIAAGLLVPRMRDGAGR